MQLNDHQLIKGWANNLDELEKAVFDWMKRLKGAKDMEEVANALVPGPALTAQLVTAERHRAGRELKSIEEERISLKTNHERFPRPDGPGGPEFFDALFDEGQADRLSKTADKLKAAEPWNA